MGRGRADRYDLAKAADLGQRGALNHHAEKVGNAQRDTVAVADPEPSPTGGPGQRVIATVNRRVDILEYERSHGRLSNDAYLEGRVIQAVFERASLGAAGGAWREGSRVDAEVAKELALLRRVSNGRLIDAKATELRDLLGEIDAGIVRQVLGENKSFAQVQQPLRLKLAAAEQGGAANFLPYGEGGKRAPSRREVAARRVGYIAARFRDALEALATSRRRNG